MKIAHEIRENLYRFQSVITSTYGTI